MALLQRAQSPLIMACGDVQYAEAWDKLQTFSETFGIPISETFAGKRAVSNASALLLGD